MKRYLIIFLITLVIAALAPTMATAAKKPIKPAKRIVKIVKKTAPKKKVVLGLKTTLLSLFNSNYINCTMPDGKTIRALKKDCDFVNDFWAKHKPQNPGPSSNNSSNNSNNNNSNNNSNNSDNNQPTPSPTPTPTPTPLSQPATITEIDTLPCGSTSCSGYKTLRFIGTNLTDAKIEFTLGSMLIGIDSSYFNSPYDAQVTGGNGTTEVIMDFYNLPCGVYGIRVTKDGQTFIPVFFYAIPCN